MNFNKLFKAFALTISLGAYTLFANPIIKLSEDKSDYEQTETGYVLKFDLEATADELKTIQANIADLSDRVKMTTELKANGDFACVYMVDHQNQPEYVYKMLLANGFDGIIYQGKAESLSKIVDILYSYQ